MAFMGLILKTIQLANQLLVICSQRAYIQFKLYVCIFCDFEVLFSDLEMVLVSDCSG